MGIGFLVADIRRHGTAYAHNVTAHIIDIICIICTFRIGENGVSWKINVVICRSTRVHAARNSNDAAIFRSFGFSLREKKSVVTQANE